MTFVLTGCATRYAREPGAAVGRAESGFIDLEPGWRVRVVTPILKSGGYRLKLVPEAINGTTITLSAPDDFLGYEVACYAVTARRGVEFVSAEITRDGRTTPQPRPTVRLFQFPRNARYVRLIYLVRMSQQDHDMAVAAAKDRGALEALTQRVQANPADACRSEHGAFCSWIPAGIAAVPQRQAAVGGAVEWIPAR